MISQNESRSWSFHGKVQHNLQLQNKKWVNTVVKYKSDVVVFFFLLNSYPTIWNGSAYKSRWIDEKSGTVIHQRYFNLVKFEFEKACVMKRNWIYMRPIRHSTEQKTWWLCNETHIPVRLKLHSNVPKAVYNDVLKNKGHSSRPPIIITTILLHQITNVFNCINKRSAQSHPFS